jgi:hypothetical protein
MQIGYHTAGARLGGMPRKIGESRVEFAGRGTLLLRRDRLP